MFLFFDIGDTLIDESPYARFIHQSLHRLFAARGMEATIDEFLSHWDAMVARKGWRGFFTMLKDLAEIGGYDVFFAMELFQEYALHVAPRAPELFQPFPDAHATLEALSSLAHASDRLRLGILANQPLWIRQRLEDWSLLRFFELPAVIISDEVGVSKPQPEIFQFALYRAGVKPEEAVMIGNEFRNDIAPAKALGWRTIWLRRPNPYQRTQPPEPDDISAADVCIAQLSDVPMALHKLLENRSP